MKFTSQQRINNISCELVQELTKFCRGAQEILTKGLDFPAGTPEGYPALKATGEEVLAALGENGKYIQSVVEFVLDGQVAQLLKPPTGKASSKKR